MAISLDHVLKLMDRKKHSHKGQNGKALVVGGSDEYTTAPALAAIAALRAGCDSVTVAAPEQVAWAINMICIDLMTIKIPGDSLNIKNVKDALRASELFDAVLVGNGIGRKGDKFCNTFVRKCTQLKVIDADALKSIGFKDCANSLLTPHETELEIMLVESGKEFLIEKLRSSNHKEKADILQGNLRYFLHNNNVLLVKGSTDIIISKNKVAFNRTGNQGMTKAGTGDILAGLCLGFLAKTGDLFKSAVAASFINGYVGDHLLNQKKGYSFIASDILEDLEKIHDRAQKLGEQEIKLKSKEDDLKKKAEKKKQQEESEQKKLEEVMQKLAEERKKLDEEKKQLAEEAKKFSLEKKEEIKKLKQEEADLKQEIKKQLAELKKAEKKVTKTPVKKEVKALAKKAEKVVQKKAPVKKNDVKSDSKKPVAKKKVSAKEKVVKKPVKKTIAKKKTIKKKK